MVATPPCLGDLRQRLFKPHAASTKRNTCPSAVGQVLHQGGMSKRVGLSISVAPFLRCRRLKCCVEEVLA